MHQIGAHPPPAEGLLSGALVLGEVLVARLHRALNVMDQLPLAGALQLSEDAIQRLAQNAKEVGLGMAGWAVRSLD